jgi:hypothetical protein
MSRSVALSAALGLLLTLLAPTVAEAGGRLFHRRACPPPCPAPCPPAYLPAAPVPGPVTAPPAAPAQAAAIKICMVCDGGIFRAATAGEFDICVLLNKPMLGQPCSGQIPPGTPTAAPFAAPTRGRTCEPWCRLYCDHTTGWRYPRNYQEWQESTCLTVSHLGRQCWFPDDKGAPPHPMPK